MSKMSRNACMVDPCFASPLPLLSAEARLLAKADAGEVISHRKMRYGWGLSPYEECDSRRHPHPNPPPHAGEGAHLLRGDYSSRSNHAYTPIYACLTVSVFIISPDVPDARIVPASSK